VAVESEKQTEVQAEPAKQAEVQAEPKIEKTEEKK
jgi:large subunit ribosomal protein L19